MTAFASDLAPKGEFVSPYDQHKQKGVDYLRLGSKFLPSLGSVSTCKYLDLVYCFTLIL